MRPSLMLQYKAILELFQKLHLQIYASQFMTSKLLHFHLFFESGKCGKEGEKL